MKLYLLGGLVLLGAWLATNASPEQKVVFLDVGQGDSILLQDGTKQVLIDGGPGIKVLEELGEQMPYWDRRIEVVILSHPDKDHLEGLLHVIERYDVDLVLLPRAASPTLMQEEWLQRLLDHSTQWRFSWERQNLKVGDIQLTILGPWSESVQTTNINNASTLVRVDFHNLSLLLTGDAEKKIERALVARNSRAQLNVKVLKAGHHGSKSSTSAFLIDAAKPTMAVIPVGSNNKYGHPTEEVLDRLKNTTVWRTDENGAIKFSWLDKKWFIVTEK